MKIIRNANVEGSKIYIPGVQPGVCVGLQKDGAYINLITVDAIDICNPWKVQKGDDHINSITTTRSKHPISDCAIVSNELNFKPINHSDTADDIKIIGELSVHRYAFIYKDKSSRRYRCINKKNPMPINFLPMIWDTHNIPDGIDSVITRIEDINAGGGCIWKNGFMVLNMDDSHIISDIEKFGFEENIRICMGYAKSEDDYKFEYLDGEVGKCEPLTTEDILCYFGISDPFKSEPVTAKPVMTKYVSNGPEKFPILVHGDFNEKMDSMLCKEVSFSITLGFNSTITGIGTLVFGAGGNTSDLIIIVDDRDMKRISDMRFTADDINKMKGFIIRTRRNSK
jgi:hypothetical protein